MIHVDGIGKTFLVPVKRGRRLWPVPQGRQLETFQALKSVTFDVGQGEVVGLQGANGSGKTTLMRILAGVLTPTVGTVSVKGSIVPLLALGAGFQEHLTGRENVLLNAAVMGFPKKLAEARMTAIWDYSGLGDHFDVQLRYYSTGMRSRLGFSVAVHLDADILLLDEVFAVGDGEFRKQAAETMNELLTSGITAIVTSHDQALLNRLCNRTLVLSAGCASEDSEK